MIFNNKHYLFKQLCQVQSCGTKSNDMIIVTDDNGFQHTICASCASLLKDCLQPEYRKAYGKALKKLNVRDYRLSDNGY
jgi:hypothetical protein